jgi:hypothetical protein
LFFLPTFFSYFLFRSTLLSFLIPFPSHYPQEEQEDWSDEEAPSIEPFNLRSENEEGYFDRNGNYVENKMDREVQDAWLDEYDEKWAKKVRTYLKKKKENLSDLKPNFFKYYFIIFIFFLFIIILIFMFFICVYFWEY